MGDWDGVRLWGGGDAAQVQARLAAGADPCAPSGSGGLTMLHAAAELASPEVVAAMAGAARQLDGLVEGRSALWLAVYSGRYENAQVLAAAGADPWLSMMAGWSPGRLILAGPEPELFPGRPAGASLTPVEAEAAALGRELKATLTGFHFDGTGLLCIADLDAAEAVRRLDGTPMSEEELLAHNDVEVDEDFDPEEEDEDAWRWLDDVHDLRLVGVTDVPGGCVVTQPWGYQPQTPVVGRTLSAGTIAYGVYANPKSGNQGSIFTDGTITGWDLHPGGSPWEDATSGEVLLSYLYRSNAAAYACGYVGLRPPNARPVTGPPHAWVLLPERNYWHDSVRS
ncbi:MAG TPA: ankyrin repeat domain-containing protein [Pseudonocardiaceae bacterium]